MERLARTARPRLGQQPVRGTADNLGNTIGAWLIAAANIRVIGVAEIGGYVVEGLLVAMRVD